VMLAFTTRRAQALADKEINFVAAVSHELRTPLAVISSAADNLADGVVQGEDQLIRYGATIQSQARRLSDLVEQILLFAATRQGGKTYALASLRVGDIVEVALRNTDGLIRHEGFVVEQDISAALPPVTGDPTAVSQVLQNLITNAVKYGGPAKWIGIRAVIADAGSAKEVEISVQDRGFGIEDGELQLIFEPFYRSPAVASAQIHGTGLGLPLARSIAEAMGGRLTVRSKPGEGSTFSLYLRVAQNLSEPTVAGERKFA
jgi:signal transduction histidine kinase